MKYLEIFKTYMQTQKQLSRRTKNQYLADVSAFLLWCRDTKNKTAFVQEIQREDIDTYISSRKVAAASKQRYLSSLRKFFTHLKTEGMIPFSPFEKASPQQHPEDIKLQEFRHYLVIYKASDLTVKYYSLDIKHFFAWLKNGQ